MTRKQNADELAETIEQLTDDEQQLVADFIETIQDSEANEVENFKKGLVSRTTKREKAAAREKQLEDMTLAETKQAFFGVGTPTKDDTEDVTDATDKFLKGAARDCS